jgi:hypothetical protein
MRGVRGGGITNWKWQKCPPRGMTRIQGNAEKGAGKGKEARD